VFLVTGLRLMIEVVRLIGGEVGVAAGPRCVGNAKPSAATSKSGQEEEDEETGDGIFGEPEQLMGGFGATSRVSDYRWR